MELELRKLEDLSHGNQQRVQLAAARRCGGPPERGVARGQPVRHAVLGRQVALELRALCVTQHGIVHEHLGHVAVRQLPQLLRVTLSDAPTQEDACWAAAQAWRGLRVPNLRAALRAGPGDGYIFPFRTRRKSVIGPARGFVVDPPTN
jgi:hypothetical protein